MYIKAPALLVISLVFFSALLSLAVFSVSASTTAVVFTDKPDYRPTDTVTITGKGFLHNHYVSLTIVKPNGYTFTATSYTNTSGIFVYKYNPLMLSNGTYTVKAKDGINSAITIFTDAAQDTYSIFIKIPANSTVISNPVQVIGEWNGTNPVGNVSQYNVQIIWGDGNSSAPININRTSSGEKTNQHLINGTYDTEPIVGCTAADNADDNCNNGNFDHTYSVTGCTPFTVIAKLYHGEPAGAEDASTNVNITICPQTTSTTTTTTTRTTTTTTTATTTTTTIAKVPTGNLTGKLDVASVGGILFLGNVAPWLDSSNFTENTTLNDTAYGFNNSNQKLAGHEQFESPLLRFTVINKTGTYSYFTGSVTYQALGAAFVQNITNQTEKHLIQISIIGNWIAANNYTCNPFLPGNIYCNGTAKMTIEDLSGNWQCFIRNITPPFNYLNNTNYCFNDIKTQVFLNTFQFNITPTTVTIDGKSGSTDVINKTNMTITVLNRIITQI